MHIATGESLHRVRQAMAMSTMHLGEYLDVLPPEKIAAAENFFGALGNAPMAIAISVPAPSDDLTRINSYLAAGCALENMLLAATAEGLGGCTLTASFFVRDSLIQIFGLGEEREILSLVLFGYPAEQPAAPEHDADIVTFHT
jgi:nitroreductase